MAAPTGVNEELPGEPAKAGRAGAELAEPQAAEAETSEAETSETETSETETSDTRTAEAGTTEAAPVQAVEEAKEKAAPAGPIPAEVVPPQAGPAGEERVPAGPADATSAGAETAETEAAEETGDWDVEEVRRDVSPLAVVGIILGVIALVGVAAGVLVVVTHGFRPKTVVTYRPAAVFGLRPGQCVNSGSDALNATVVSCARPHDAEVFAVFTLPAAPWPGASAVRVDADNGCASRFGGYIDSQLTTASLTQEFVYPNKVAWQARQRTVVCEVSATDGRLTGSVRANG
jgi:putative regulator of septum formation